MISVSKTENKYTSGREKTLNYSEIKTTDVANGPGSRTSLFVSGCRRHCHNCFNPETWNFEHGLPFTDNTIKTIIDSLEPSYIQGLTLLGGEPMEPENQEDILKLIKQVKEIYPTKTIWLFSGFTIEELLNEENDIHTPNTIMILENCNVLVDGAYDESLHNVALRFRGSSNQRIIDLPKTIEAKKVVLWEDDPVFASHEKEQITKMDSFKKSSGAVQEQQNDEELENVIEQPLIFTETEDEINSISNDNTKISNCMNNVHSGAFDPII